jgi:hypothetical protein
MVVLPLQILLPTNVTSTSLRRTLPMKLVQTRHGVSTHDLYTTILIVLDQNGGRLRVAFSVGTVVLHVV